MEDHAQAGRGIVVKLDEAVEYIENGISSKTVFRVGAGEGTLFYLAPDQVLPEHQTFEPSTVHIIGGSGTFEMSGESHPAVPDRLFFLPPRLPYVIKSDSGGKGLAFLMTKFYGQG